MMVVVGALLAAFTMFTLGIFESPSGVVDRNVSSFEDNSSEATIKAPQKVKSKKSRRR